MSCRRWMKPPHLFYILIFTFGVILSIVLAPRSIIADRQQTTTEPSHDVSQDEPSTIAPTNTPTPSIPLPPEDLGVVFDFPQLSTAQRFDYDYLDDEQLQGMVSQTAGFFSRDYSVWLGWNNMRYIIDAAFLQAKLLNRTLILPSFVYARGCEYDPAVCSSYAGLAPTLGEGERKLSGWRIPLTAMLNVTRMRRIHPVILMKDYLRLHKLGEGVETGSGLWERERYPAHSTFVVEKNEYEPKKTVRVDAFSGDILARVRKPDETGGSKKPEEDNISRYLHIYVKPVSGTADYDIARNILKRTDFAERYDLQMDEGFEACLHENGWEVLYTFDKYRKTDMARTVANPMRQVAPRQSLRAWANDYGGVDAEVLVISGETHSERKAGTMMFTTREALETFQRTILYDTVPPDILLALGETMAERMKQLVDGRLWMGAHMRRGDFVSNGWAVSMDPEKHLWRVKAHIEMGRKELLKITEVQSYDVPDAAPSLDVITLERPKQQDPFFVATDERDLSVLKMFRDTGAVLLDDLLTIDDRRVVGWPLLFTDLRGVVEQVLLAHAAYFTGSSLSSFAGGIVNMRAARGADRRTVFFS